MADSAEAFPGWIGQQFALGGEPGNDAFFGPDVLRGLVDGIDDFVAVRHKRWGWRRGRPAMLACSPWMSDRALVKRLRDLAAVCVVVSKQSPGSEAARGLAWLRAIHRYVPGFPVQGLSELRHMAPKVGGEPLVVGPYDAIENMVLPPIRTLGYRSIGGRPAPMAHAKLALLGHLWWGEQDALGNPDEFLVFTARRLWVSSANFTSNSRRSLEFGFWTEDEALLGGARTFLVQLLAASEDLDAEANVPTPDLASVRYDDAAMAEAAAELSWDSEDE